MGRGNHPSTNFWAALRSSPPIMVRLSARCSKGGNNCRALSSEEIAIVADIALDRVLEISALPTWAEVTLGEAERFCRACNFDPTNPSDIKRQREYARSCLTNPNRPPFQYLRRSPWWQTEFRPLVELLSRFQKSASFDSPSRQQITSGFFGSTRKTHA